MSLGQIRPVATSQGFRDLSRFRDHCLQRTKASGKASPHGWKLRRAKMTRKEEHTACSRFHLTEALGLKQVQQRKQTSMILVLKRKANSGCSSPGRGKVTNCSLWCRVSVRGASQGTV